MHKLSCPPSSPGKAHHMPHGNRRQARARHHGALTGATTALPRRRQRAASRACRGSHPHDIGVSAVAVARRAGYVGDNIDLALLLDLLHHVAQHLHVQLRAPHLSSPHTLQTPPRGNCAQAASNTSTTRTSTSTPEPGTPATPRHPASCASPLPVRRRCRAEGLAPQSLPFRVYAHK